MSDVNIIPGIVAGILTVLAAIVGGIVVVIRVRASAIETTAKARAIVVDAEAKAAVLTVESEAKAKAIVLSAAAVQVADHTARDVLITQWAAQHQSTIELLVQSNHKIDEQLKQIEIINAQLKLANEQITRLLNPKSGGTLPTTDEHAADISADAAAAKPVAAEEKTNS